MYNQCLVINECNRLLTKQPPRSYDTANHSSYRLALWVSPKQSWINFEAAVYCRDIKLHFFNKLFSDKRSYLEIFIIGNYQGIHTL